MENDQPSTDQALTAPQLLTAPEDSEMNNKKKSVAPCEDQVSVVGSNSTSSNNQARVYECIFCKRGFATAQALGGHMNIHRKDKEKLKHRYPGWSSIDQTAQPMDMVIPRMIQHSPQGQTAQLMDVVIPRMIHHRPQAPPPPPVVSWGNWMIQEEGKKAEVKGSDENNWLSTNSEEGKSLPLFVDRPLNKRDREEQGLVGDHQDEIPMIGGRENVDEGKSSSEGHGSSDVSVVDLELRLGPEPRDPSLSTRKFL